ncbi:hypothetical protein SmJEL517_g02306 [Synchytrium microbalum]|uniref:RRM domain-containing protein n=1 Tax=Synchytrium microbalum TaxID=1806994 RepID=A0A507C138_9FUNG|nr:uncharacterized protein SmJEL517_g02306 [Synchytrium microbalum]TPX35230.1 hypothetical protein SmJEL517_g02306 [Synchytrium microbalum]
MLVKKATELENTTLQTDPLRTKSLPDHPAPVPVRATATNTLILVGIPPEGYEDSARHIRTVLERFGVVRRITLLKSFGRILCTFDVTRAALNARRELHDTVFCGNEPIRVYFGQHTDLDQLTQPTISRLQVPHPEKNFLLSPPGSPPVGWVQIQEGGPSAGGHAELHDVWHELMNEETFSLDHNTGDNDSTGTASQFSSIYGQAYEDESTLEARSTSVLAESIDDSELQSDSQDDGATRELSSIFAGTRIGGGEVIWPLRREAIGSVPTIMLESADGDFDDHPSEGSHGLSSLPNRSPTPLPRTAMPPIE